MSKAKKPSLLCMWAILTSLPLDHMYYNFSWISSYTHIARDRIRVHVKELRRLGYVDFARGLMDDDGNVQGAGYAITKAGQEWAESLVLCETCHRPRLIHACGTCSPGWPVAAEAGPGCINCRQTGWDQTPCLPLAEPGRLA
jgi:hypothetical protein